MIDKRKFQCYIIRTVYSYEDPAMQVGYPALAERNKVFNSQMI